MKKYIFSILFVVFFSQLAFAQQSFLNNPFSSKGEIVTPIIHSSLVNEIVVVSHNPGPWKFSSSVNKQDGKEIIEIKMDAPKECIPAQFNVYFTFPQEGAFNFWTSDVYCGTHLDPFWGNTNTSSSLTHRMPLYEYFSDNETNCLTIACSETIKSVEGAFGVMEEGCVICSELRFFRENEAPINHYETKILLDRRPMFWSETIQEASQWIMETSKFIYFPVPETALEPVYSTWYQFHQKVNSKTVEEECALASKLGMKTIILDDGWQTDDENRGYSFCGDWKPSTSKFPDMTSHIRTVRNWGMKYMVWYSVPYVGIKSEAYKKFREKVLYIDWRNQAAVLDPRFPEVREYIISIYTDAIKAWDVDGFKLDFIDSFTNRGEDPAKKESYAGRDIMNVNDAVNVLMKDISYTLKAIKPDIMIEFRQSYIGQGIRQYGNMFRAADCPGNAKDNRMRIASLRLTSGETAVHSDMLEWNISESKENVARAIINSIFGVIQYSMRLNGLPEDHLKVIKKWMDFASKHKKTLLQSNFKPRHPELGYPIIEAEGENEHIVAVYQENVIVDATDKGKSLFLLNASGKDSIAIRKGDKILNIKVKRGEWKEIKM